MSEHQTDLNQSSMMRNELLFLLDLCVIFVLICQSDLPRVHLHYLSSSSSPLFSSALTNTVITEQNGNPSWSHSDADCLLQGDDLLFSIQPSRNHGCRNSVSYVKMRLQLYYRTQSAVMTASLNLLCYSSPRSPLHHFPLSLS